MRGPTSQRRSALPSSGISPHALTAASFKPGALPAVTRHLSCLPTSAALTTYVALAAPAIATLFRSHWYEYSIGAVPAQVPLLQVRL